jgi:hypothetical protein
MEKHSVYTRNYEQHKNNTITKLAVDLNSYQVLDRSRCSALACEMIDELFQVFINQIRELRQEQKLTDNNESFGSLEFVWTITHYEKERQIGINSSANFKINGLPFIHSDVRFESY